MTELLFALVCLPFASAFILGLVRNSQVRRIVTYLSTISTIGVALVFCIAYFVRGAYPIEIELSHSFIHITDMCMLALEVCLMLLIVVMSIKYKKYHAALFSVIQTGAIIWYELKSGWMPEYEYSRLYIDWLTIIMVFIIAVVGTLITVYALGYMHDYQHHHTEFKDRRKFFFAMLYIFLGAMFGLVFSNSLSWMYFFWEITSVVSFLLIGYTKTKEAIDNSFTALWMNLLGGCGFAGGIIWIGYSNGISDMQSLISTDAAIIVAPIILLSFAALTKSAQLPFSKWLLGAMVAPTPSSALLHSATMVKAGVYLLLRLSPVLANNYAGTLVSLIGGFTFLIMSMLAITVSDGKKVLAYSTISNLGLITACAGVGVEETVWAGVFLLIFHAISKSLLFQTVGSIEHATGSRDIETMHGLSRRHPYLAWTLVIGIAGMYLAPFGMLISKWAALKAFVDSGSIILVLLLCFGSATTLFYWTKWMATVLASKTNDVKAKNTTSANQWFSILVHAIMMIALCFFFPLISSAIIIPYINNVFADATEVISNDNIIIMLLMLFSIFAIPAAAWISARHTKYRKVTRYINGVNAGDQMNYIDSYGEKRRFFLANWYMEDIFGEKKIWMPSIIISSVAIVVLMVITLGGAI
ncbi:MAG: NADH-quinone oxidoreductase subunit L [Eubacterium sp.]|nr:NADH-quinone oxidoreductase subunit L [Eubacterium sp.]